MALPGSLHLSPGLGLCRNQGFYFSNQSPSLPCRRHKLKRLNLFKAALSSRISVQKLDFWGLQFLGSVYKPSCIVPRRVNAFSCHSSLAPGHPGALPLFKAVSTALERSSAGLQSNPIILNLVPAVGIIIFAVWGVGPFLCHTRGLLLDKRDSNWKKSRTYLVMTSYIRPMLLWIGAILFCRALQPLVLTTEASKMVKQRVLNFVRSLSTVLAFAYCISSAIRQAQNSLTETSDSKDPRKMGFQFAGRVIYSAVWIAAFSLFMELLGFSTQKWVTAGGLGTVLLTLAGREIFTNFLSSAMIHATRPFVVNEWIQTKIQGYEVSGTVEHVGWWSPTIIRGEDREAVHIPNHKFTVNVVRNLTQKTHWRIKTHLAISHLDVNKINNIVADMRKVLAKNPQVEQKKLHRRVFLDNVNPENQALLILVSCFVKTSHYEEYLCVKEAILLDLLKVISHHRARLATPIRTMQKMYSDTDLENIPYSDLVFSRSGPVSNRALLMIEPPYRVSGEDKKSQSRTMRTDGEQDVQTPAQSKSDGKKDNKVAVSSVTNSKVKETPSQFTADSNMDVASSMEDHTNREASRSDVQNNEEAALKSNTGSTLKRNVDVSDGTSVKATTGAAPAISTQKASVGKQSNGQTGGNSRDSDSDCLISSSSSSSDKPGKSSVTLKQEDEKKPAASPHTSRTPLEENIVLDVALAGSKKTLPIEEGMDSPPSNEEAKEVTTRGSGKGPCSAAETDRKRASDR